MFSNVPSAFPGAASRCTTTYPAPLRSAAVTAGVLILGLPETHGQPLPETIADVTRGAHTEYTAAADQVFVIDDDEDEDEPGAPLADEQ